MLLHRDDVTAKMWFSRPAELWPECFASPAPADSTQGPEGDKIEALFGQLMELLTMSLFLDLWQNYPIFLRCVTIEQVIQLIQLGQVPDVKSGQDCSFNIWHTPTCWSNSTAELCLQTRCAIPRCQKRLGQTEGTLGCDQALPMWE